MFELYGYDLLFLCGLDKQNSGSRFGFVIEYPELPETCLFPCLLFTLVLYYVNKRITMYNFSV
jgi:hypothetical protein